MAEELLEVLSQDAEPLVAQWARGLRGKVRDREDLLEELSRLESEGGPVAWSLSATVRQAWRDFGGAPLPGTLPSAAQPPLPLT